MPAPRTIDLFWHPDVLEHDTGAGMFEIEAPAPIAVAEPHPEGVQRILNMKAVLERGPLADAVRLRAGRQATREELTRVHTDAYVEAIEALAAAGGGRLTPSTVVSPGTWGAARAAAGTVVASVEAALAGDACIAYALVRPPGHHAQPAQADGYCIFNNVAIAAEAARARGVRRVAIVDVDVHHGNGTQACFYERADVLTVSLHMRHGSWGDSHPQTGSALETGAGAGAGFNVNVELPVGTGDSGYAEALTGVAVPIVERFAPELLIVALGQDASQFDPNGRQCLSMAGFRRLGTILGDLAGRCGGRVVLAQEGGYAPCYAAFCLHAALEGVAGAADATLADPLAFLPDDAERGRASIDAARAAHARHWGI